MISSKKVYVSVQFSRSVMSDLDLTHCIVFCQGWFYLYNQEGMSWEYEKETNYLS